MPALELVLLGTGSPLPSPDRCGAGQVIVAGDTRILVDCGWGVARRLFLANLPPPLIDALCFTHLHSDHITDFPDLVIMRWTGGATKPLAVYGPPGTRAMVESFLAALSEDIRFRFAHHGDKLSRDGIRVETHEFAPTPARTRVASIGPVVVDAFAVDHFPVEPAVGLRIESAGHSIVISGDTKACDSLTEAARGADVLICEAMHAGMIGALSARLRAGGQPGTADVLDDVPDYHISPVDAARTAKEAGVPRLVLSHLVPPVPPSQQALIDAFTAGMSDVYDGEITVGKDLDRFVVAE